MSVVSASSGALVWVRRRNGSWWPGRILGPNELPEGCTPPPRSTGTPIMLLGREEGSVDWYNLEKSMRVKAFRCGEYDECIEKAKVQAAFGRRREKGAKYVRREDAIIHALELEKAHLLMDGCHEEQIDNSTCTACDASTSSRTNKRSWRSSGNTATGRESLSVIQKQVSTTFLSTRYKYASKRRKQNDLEGFNLEGFQRIRDPHEVGSMKKSTQKSILSRCKTGPQEMSLSCELESNYANSVEMSGSKRDDSQLKRDGKNPKKKDRRRPLSKLCEGTRVITPSYCTWRRFGGGMVNGLEGALGSDVKSMQIDKCFDILDPSSLETPCDPSCSTSTTIAEAVQLDESELACTERYGDVNCSDFFADVPLIMGDVSVSEEDFSLLFGFPESMNAEPLQTEEQFDCGRSCPVPSHDPDDWIDTRNIEIFHPLLTWQDNNGADSMSPHDLDQKDAVSYLEPADDILISEKKSDGILELDTKLLDEPYKSATHTQLGSHNILQSGNDSIAFASRPIVGHSTDMDAEAVNDNAKSSEKDQPEPLLYNVELTVQQSLMRNPVPVISLMSRTTGKPIVGHPISVQVLSDIPTRTECRPAADGLGLGGLLKKNKAGKPHRQKKSGFSPRKMRRLSSFASGHPSHREDGKKLAPRAAVELSRCGPIVACVPLRLVFSRIREALSLPP